MHDDTERAQIDELSRQLYDLKKSIAGNTSKEELPDHEFTVFDCRVGDDHVGLLQEDVDEVVQFARLTPLPESAPWVLGLLNLLPVRGLFRTVDHHRRRALPTFSDSYAEQVVEWLYAHPKPGVSAGD